MTRSSAIVLGGVHVFGVTEKPIQMTAEARGFSAPSSIGYWRLAQAILFLGGIGLLFTLLVWPQVGLHLFWNGLIPAAPALIVIAPGLWRNICPMATAGLLPRHFGFSKRKPMTKKWVGRLGLLSLMALLVIVPLRHVILNTNGPMTALMLCVASIIAFSMGLIFEWRSGWCTSLCPIHPVERLYGTSPAIRVANANCGPCEKCSVPCPDSTVSMTPAVTGTSRFEYTNGQLLIGGFAGYVWGWYQVPDYLGSISPTELFNAFAWPMGGFVVSYILYWALNTYFVSSKEARQSMVRIFATAAVSIYYWYRIPMLVGLGPFPGTGMLIDLSASLPFWFEFASRTLTTSFFIWFLLVRKDPRTSWLVRPTYSVEALKKS